MAPGAGSQGQHLGAGDWLLGIVSGARLQRRSTHARHARNNRRSGRKEGGIWPREVQIKPGQSFLVNKWGSVQVTRALTRHKEERRGGGKWHSTCAVPPAGPCSRTHGLKLARLAHLLLSATERSSADRCAARRS